MERFIPASSIHSHGTRLRETGCFSIPKVKSVGKKSFGYNNGCVLLNELPGDIRSLQGYPNFNVAIKKFLLSMIDWSRLFLQYLDKFYFPFIIDICGLRYLSPFFIILLTVLLIYLVYTSGLSL